MSAARLVALGVVVVAVAAVLALKWSESAASSSADARSARALPRLVELGSDKCVPCRAMQPILAELRREYPDRLRVDFIDVWRQRDSGAHYRVEAIPTQILFDSTGREVYRHTGFIAKHDLLAAFRAAGVTL